MERIVYVEIFKLYVVFAGICARDIELVEASTGKPALDKQNNLAVDDRFKLKVPVSDQYVTWEVFFNCSLPNCPPDFDLNDLEFFYSFTLDTMEQLLPSLNDWDHRKEKALINVISELRSAYLKYQVEKVQLIDNRCAFEYNSLIKDSKIPVDQIEVLVEGNVVHFLIKLDVELTKLLQSADQTLPLPPEEYVVLLAVRWGSLRNANLITSPEAVKLVGASLDLPRNIRSEEKLSEYVEEMGRSVESQLLTLRLQRLDRRKTFVFDLLRHLGRSVICYDALEYHSASALLEQRGFICLLEVNLPALFPAQQPIYRLVSVYGMISRGRPFTQQMKLGEAAGNAERALNLIKNKLPAFRQCLLSAYNLPS